MVKLVPIKDVKLASAEDYAVFGGTFDPFHRGHLSVVISLMKLFRFVAIAPTKKNPWKEKWASDYPHRLEMIRLICEAEKILLCDENSAQGVHLSVFPYEYAEEAVHWWRAKRSGELYWAVGEDSAAGVASWRNWPNLAVCTVTAPIIYEVHATDIRLGRYPIHPAILEYVKNHGLFDKQQN